MFSPLVLSHWHLDAASSWSEGEALVAVDSALPANRSVSLLHVADGRTVLALSPARATELALTDGASIRDAELAASLERSAIPLNDPDHLFYLTLAEQSALLAEARGSETRQLEAGDAAAFAELTANAPADDVDEAFVELDHWLVFGTFVGDTLASAASMFPWRGSKLADVGVITLPEFRGRGLGRATVRAISAVALARGFEPQYRCQRDNAASVALAQAAGFARFGDWQVIDSDG